MAWNLENIPDQASFLICYVKSPYQTAYKKSETDMDGHGSFDQMSATRTPYRPLLTRSLFKIKMKFQLKRSLSRRDRRGSRLKRPSIRQSICQEIPFIRCFDVFAAFVNRQMFISSYAEAVDTVPKPEMKPVVYEKKMKAIDKQIASELPPPYCKLQAI